MKILQVIPYFSPNRGGDVRVCYNLSRYLALNGHEVTIATTDFEYDKDFAASTASLGINVLPFKCSLNIILFLISPSMNSWISKNINKFDVMHLNGFRTYQNSVISNAAFANNTPYILQAHGDLPYFEKRSLKMLYDTVWGYKILRHAAKAFALTATEFNDYVKWGMNREKIEIIPNGIDPLEYEQLPEKGLFRKSLNISPLEKIILYLGRIHKIKGLDLLVRAFADYDKEVGNAKLIIVGPDSGYLPQLTKLVQQLDLSDKVIFTGPIYGQEKLKAYVDSDVYVLPSIYEAFPNTILEACACGTPVIVTSGCGICNTIREIGLVVNYDKDELKTAIFNILSDESLRMRLGKDGRSLVFSQFSLPIIAEQIENAYIAAIDANHQ